MQQEQPQQQPQQLQNNKNNKYKHKKQQSTKQQRRQQQRCNNNNHNNNKILSCSLSNDVFHLRTDMVKWPKNEATRGNQYPEPNFTGYANFVLCRTKKKLNFLSNFTKIRTNFKRENKKYFAYYPGPTGEFTGSSVGHNYLRKNGMNLPIVALNRSLRDLSIVGV